MLSRREWLAWIAVLAGLAGLAQHSKAAETPGKVSKAAAKYQDTPKNGQTCGMCKFYIPPGGHAGSGMMGGNMGPGMMAAGTCQVVEGSISPRGWCILYQPLSG
jgi:hypothetical protein